MDDKTINLIVSKILQIIASEFKKHNIRDGEYFDCCEDIYALADKTTGTLRLISENLLIESKRIKQKRKSCLTNQ